METLSKRCRSVFGVVVLLMLAALAADAPDSLAQENNEDAAFRRKLQEADRHLRRGGSAQARRIYEELVLKRPESGEAFLGLVSARIAAYDLDGLSDLVEERIADNPGDPSLLIALGEVRVVAGDKEGALSVWRSAIPLFDEREEGFVRVARQMEKRLLLTEAIDLLVEGRRTVGGRFLYAGDLCRLYGLIGEGEQAGREWVRAAAGEAVKSSEALRRLRELKGDGEIGGYPYVEIDAILDSLPELRGVREIRAECRLADGQCGGALADYRELERTVRKHGAYLLPFARHGAVKGCAEEAAAAAEELARRSDRPTIRLEARFLLARIRRDSGDPEEAVRIYREIVKETRNPADQDRARFEIAKVLIDETGDGEGAIPVLEELLGHPAYDRRDEARFALVDALLLAGRIEDSGAECDRIFADATKDAVRERALFGKGEAFFYAGKFDEALAEYRRVIDQFPAGLYLNDAISRSIFVSGHRDAGDGALQEYTAALLMVMRRDFQGARGKLDEMLDALVLSKLRDEMVFQVARIEEEEGRFREAVKSYDRLVEEFPGERLAHEASVRAADIWCTRIGDLQKGIERYEKFLVDYPTSILADEARRKKREAERAEKS